MTRRARKRPRFPPTANPGLGPARNHGADTFGSSDLPDPPTISSTITPARRNRRMWSRCTLFVRPPWPWACSQSSRSGREARFKEVCKTRKSPPCPLGKAGFFAVEGIARSIHHDHGPVSAILANKRARSDRKPFARRELVQKRERGASRRKGRVFRPTFGARDGYRLGLSGGHGVSFIPNSRNHNVGHHLSMSSSRFLA